MPHRTAICLVFAIFFFCLQFFYFHQCERWQLYHSCPLSTVTLMPTRGTHAVVNFPWCLSAGHPILFLTNSWFLLYAASFDTYRTDDSNTEHALSLWCPVEMEDKQLFWFFSNCFIAVYANPRNQAWIHRTVPEAKLSERHQAVLRITAVLFLWISSE